MDERKQIFHTWFEHSSWVHISQIRFSGNTNFAAKEKLMPANGSLLSFRTNSHPGKMKEKGGEVLQKVCTLGKGGRLRVNTEGRDISKG